MINGHRQLGLSKRAVQVETSWVVKVVIEIQFLQVSISVTHFESGGCWLPRYFPFLINFNQIVAYTFTDESGPDNSSQS